MLDRVDRHNPAYLPTGVFYSEGAKRARGKYFECLTVKQRTAGIVRLVINVVSERLEPRPKIRFGERTADLQTEGCAGPIRRHRQALHHGLCRGQKQDRLFGPGKAPQD